MIVNIIVFVREGLQYINKKLIIEELLKSIVIKIGKQACVVSIDISSRTKEDIKIIIDHLFLYSLQYKNIISKAKAVVVRLHYCITIHDETIRERRKINSGKNLLLYSNGFLSNYQHLDIKGSFIEILIINKI